MIEWLESIDRHLVLAINSWHTPALDELFWYISAKWTWIPLYLLLIYLIWTKLGTKKTLLFIGLVLLTIAVVDLTSVLLFKNTFQRYRPSHHALLTNHLHFYKLPDGSYYKGGMYGFISSHASNFFAISILTGFTLRRFYPKLLPVLITISVIVCVSRMYLGVHYLSDLIGGAVWGGLFGWLGYRFLAVKLLPSGKTS